IARVRNVLTDYRRSLEQLGAERALLVATSAVRDAENGHAFLGEIEWSYGFTTRLVSGQEEAELSFCGATLGRRLAVSTLVVDVGGGSSELVLGDGDGIRATSSVDAGSVRMTERYLHRDPPGVRELDNCATAVRSLLREGAPADPAPTAAIGVAA